MHRSPNSCLLALALFASTNYFCARAYKIRSALRGRAEDASTRELRHSLCNKWPGNATPGGRCLIGHTGRHGGDIAIEGESAIFGNVCVGGSLESLELPYKAADSKTSIDGTLILTPESSSKRNFENVLGEVLVDTSLPDSPVNPSLKQEFGLLLDRYIGRTCDSPGVTCHDGDFVIHEDMDIDAPQDSSDPIPLYIISNGMLKIVASKITAKAGVIFYVPSGEVLVQDANLSNVVISGHGEKLVVDRSLIRGGLLFGGESTGTTITVKSSVMICEPNGPGDNVNDLVGGAIRGSAASSMLKNGSAADAEVSDHDYQAPDGEVIRGSATSGSFAYESTLDTEATDISEAADATSGSFIDGPTSNAEANDEREATDGGDIRGSATSGSFTYGTTPNVESTNEQESTEAGSARGSASSGSFTYGSTPDAEATNEKEATDGWSLEGSATSGYFAYGSDSDTGAADADISNGVVIEESVIKVGDTDAPASDVKATASATSAPLTLKSAFEMKISDEAAIAEPAIYAGTSDAEVTNAVTTGDIHQSAVSGSFANPPDTKGTDATDIDAKITDADTIDPWSIQGSATSGYFSYGSSSEAEPSAGRDDNKITQGCMNSYVEFNENTGACAILQMSSRKRLEIWYGWEGEESAEVVGDVCMADQSMLKMTSNTTIHYDVVMGRDVKQPYGIEAVGFVLQEVNQGKRIRDLEAFSDVIRGSCCARTERELKIETEQDAANFVEEVGDGGTYCFDSVDIAANVKFDKGNFKFNVCKDMRIQQAKVKARGGPRSVIFNVVGSSRNEVTVKDSNFQGTILSMDPGVVIESSHISGQILSRGDIEILGKSSVECAPVFQF